MVNFINGLLLYVAYPVFIGFLVCYMINFSIMLCTSSLVKLFSQIGIEKQCNEIFILKEKKEDQKH